MTEYEKYNVFPTTCLSNIIGTVVSVDRDANTALVLTDDFGEVSADIHYHCTDETNTDNGHWAFAKDDKILLTAMVNAGGDLVNPVVTGFTDGPKFCKGGPAVHFSTRLFSGLWHLGNWTEPHPAFPNYTLV